MKAAQLGPAPDHGLVIADNLPVPQAGPGEVQVRMRAAALNRADLAVLAGGAHGAVGGPGTVLGMEWAGEVLAVGSGVTAFQAGDRVMGSGRAALAEVVVADAGRVSPLPRADMGFDEAATLPVALQTMHDAIVTNGGLQREESVLILGASSGVGLMGLRMARHLGAGVVIGSSTDATRRAQLKDFGADVVVDTNDPAWPEQVKAATGGAGVNLIVDQLSGPTLNASMAAAALRGRIVNVGRLAGQHADFNCDLHALKRLQYIGVTFRTRTTAEVATIVERLRADLWPAVQSGRLSLPIAARFAFEQAADAYALMAANRHFGKIVVMGPGA